MTTLSWANRVPLVGFEKSRENGMENESKPPRPRFVGAQQIHGGQERYGYQMLFLSSTRIGQSEACILAGSAACFNLLIGSCRETLSIN